ncbi:MAG TPA: hypothetical protein DCY13_21740 [Verrucomicrobiales bacterium]|nr:hypothetical protein [Verrucomicrobiales bacterium]
MILNGWFFANAGIRVPAFNTTRACTGKFQKRFSKYRKIQPAIKTGSLPTIVGGPQVSGTPPACALLHLVQLRNAEQALNTPGIHPYCD